MSDIVFIFGAGTSTHAGAPLMADFLDKARDLRALNGSSEFEEDLHRVFAAIAHLQSVHSKSELDIVNLESVFGAFEMAELLGISAYSGVVASLRHVISWTLNQSMEFKGEPLRGNILPNSRPSPSTAYNDFAKLLAALEGERPRRTAAIITFNYDIGLDYALEVNHLRPSYYISDSAGGGIPLLKLHGSVNWGQCPECGCLISAPASPTLVASRSFPTYRFSKPQQFHCQKQVVDCFIVPPSWNKSEGRKGLVSVWQQAAHEFATASTIVVCGYSLPETDSFFRYLYALGTVSETVLRNFWVFDPSPEVRGRYERLMGPGARARFQPMPHPFENAVEVIRRGLLKS